MSTILYETDGPVAIITINRPEVRNACDGPTGELLFEAVQQAESDDTIVATVLTGAEGTFCAGGDLKAVAVGRGNPVTAVRADKIMASVGPMGPTRMLTEKPVIAAVEGHAVAGGLELAVWCDLRVTARDATFGVYCRRWGVPLTDGGTIRLPRLIGHSHALDMIITGRAIDGEEAYRIGLANRLVEPGEALAAAVELAAGLADFPQGCLRSDRRSSYDQWNLSLPEALAMETVMGRTVIESGETQEGAARFAAGHGRHGSF